MFSKTLAIYLRLRHHRQLKAGFGLLHDLGSRRSFHLVDPRHFLRPTKRRPVIKVDPAAKTRTFRVYNTQSGEFEYYTREDPDV